MWNAFKSLVGIGGEDEKEKPPTAEEIRRMRLEKLQKAAQGRDAERQAGDGEALTPEASTRTNKRKSAPSKAQKSIKVDRARPSPRPKAAGVEAAAVGATPSTRKAKPKVKSTSKATPPLKTKTPKPSTKECPPLKRKIPSKPTTNPPPTTVVETKNMSKSKPSKRKKFTKRVVSDATEAQSQAPRQEVPRQKQKTTEKLKLPQQSQIHAASAKETSEHWESKALSNILLISLNQSEARRKGFNYIDLSGDGESVADEDATAEDGKQNGRLASDSLDLAILARLSQSSSGDSSQLGYLVSCFRRAVRECERVAGQQDRAETVSGWVDVIVSYAWLCLNPEADVAFASSEAQRRKSTQEFIRLLGADPAISRALPKGFLQRMLDAFKGSIQEVFEPVATAIFEQAIAEKINLQTFQRPLRCLQAFVRASNEAAEALASHPRFSPGARVTCGRDVQVQTLLGPFLSAGPDAKDPKFSAKNFSAMSERASAGAQLRALAEGLTAVLSRSMKPKKSRNLIIRWLARVVRLNRARGMMSFNAAFAASDDFMVNLCAVLARLAYPFARKHSDVAKAVAAADPRFFCLPPGAGGRSAEEPLVGYGNTTRLGASEKEMIDLVWGVWAAKGGTAGGTFGSTAEDTSEDVKRGRELGSSTTQGSVKPPSASNLKPSASNPKRPQPNPKFNTVTQVFFVTLEGLHVGYHPAVRAHMRMLNQYSQVAALLQSAGGPHSSDPRASQAMHRLNFLSSYINATRARIARPTLLANLATVYNFTAAWLLGLAERAKRSSDADSGTLLRLVPEYILSDLVDFWTFIGRERRDQEAMAQATHTSFSMDSAMSEQTLVLATQVMAGDFKINNPHIRGRFAELMFTRVVDGSDTRMLTESVYVRENMLRGLVELYVAAESSHGKYTTRYHISEVLTRLWTDTQQQDQLRKMPSNNVIKFLNCLCNDAVWLLDEAIRRLEDIHNNETKIRQAEEKNFSLMEPAAARGGAGGGGVGATPVQAAQTQREFADLERGCHSLMRLANASVRVMNLISKFHVEPFVSPLMTERMAHMVDYYIHKLNGKQVSNLKVSNPKKYDFKPRNLLREMVTLFLNLSNAAEKTGKDANEFLKSVACDERSYDSKVFQRAARNMRSKGIVREDQVAEFESILARIGRIAEDAKQDELDTDDIPDKYLDPLMGSLIKDPVKLPASGVVMDRAIITRCLLNAAHDPYNRKPLTPEQLIPQPELKAEIEAYVGKKKAELRAKRGKIESQGVESGEDCA